MELDTRLTSMFVNLCQELSNYDVEIIDFALTVNFKHLWSTSKPLTATEILLRMQQLRMWSVDVRYKECELTTLIDLFYIIGRRDLSAALKRFGKYTVISLRLLQGIKN